MGCDKAIYLRVIKHFKPIWYLYVLPDLVPYYLRSAAEPRLFRWLHYCKSHPSVNNSSNLLGNPIITTNKLLKLLLSTACVVAYGLRPLRSRELGTQHGLLRHSSLKSVIATSKLTGGLGKLVLRLGAPAVHKHVLQVISPQLLACQQLQLSLKAGTPSSAPQTTAPGSRLSGVSVSVPDLTCSNYSSLIRRNCLQATNCAQHVWTASLFSAGLGTKAQLA